MKNQKKHVSEDENVSAAKLPKMEMYAVLGLESMKTILENMKSINESLEILAAQKKREMDTDEAKGK
jgi:hypothetical protein